MLLRPMLMAAAAMVALAGLPEAASRSGLSTDALLQFDQRVKAYVKLHEAVEAGLPRLQVTSDVREIERATDAMAQAMEAARATAKVGDMFTPEIAILFRTRIANAISRRGIDPVQLLISINEESDPSQMRLVVNERFECGFAMTPPVILEALPRLPSELQYRFVGPNLILLDIHSDLVVDILRDALPLE